MEADPCLRHGPGLTAKCELLKENSTLSYWYFVSQHCSSVCCDAGVTFKWGVVVIDLFATFLPASPALWTTLTCSERWISATRATSLSNPSLMKIKLSQFATNKQTKRLCVVAFSRISFMLWLFCYPSTHSPTIGEKWLHTYIISKASALCFLAKLYKCILVEMSPFWQLTSFSDNYQINRSRLPWQSKLYAVFHI